MRATDVRLIAAQPEDPGHRYTAAEARDLQKQMNSLGSEGIAEEKMYMLEHERKLQAGAQVTGAEECEYKRLLEKKRKRSEAGAC